MWWEKREKIIMLVQSKRLSSILLFYHFILREIDIIQPSCHSKTSALFDSIFKIYHADAKPSVWYKHNPLIVHLMPDLCQTIYEEGLEHLLLLNNHLLFKCCKSQVYYTSLWCTIIMQRNWLASLRFNIW